MMALAVVFFLMAPGCAAIKAQVRVKRLERGTATEEDVRSALMDPDQMVRVLGVTACSDVGCFGCLSQVAQLALEDEDVSVTEAAYQAMIDRCGEGGRGRTRCQAISWAYEVPGD